MYSMFGTHCTCVQKAFIVFQQLCLACHQTLLWLPTPRCLVHNHLYFCPCGGTRFAVVYAVGHIGFIGRAGVFIFVAVLFFRLISDTSVNSEDSTTIGNGLGQLQKNRGGRACLFILGFVLIVYGAFAVRLLLLVCHYLF